MNNQMIPFSFENRQVRMTLIDGQEWWVGKDVAESLGYKDTANAIKQHCRGVAKHHPIVDSLGRTQEVRIISEGDVWRLITHSNLPEAQRFEKWLFEEVLPQIRKTGDGGNAVELKALRESLIEITAALAAVNTFVKESEPRVKLLTSENDRLRQMNRLYKEAECLREQLARKNTPLSNHEKQQIHALSTEWTVAQIAEYTGRSATVIRRVIRDGARTLSGGRNK
jgi:prophage antirepressor-like protein